MRRRHLIFGCPSPVFAACLRVGRKVAAVVPKATSHLFFVDLAGIFASSEAASIGAIHAVRTRGLSGKVKVVTFDSSEDHLQGLRDGTVDGMLVQDPRPRHRAFRPRQARRARPAVPRLAQRQIISAVAPGLQLFPALRRHNLLRLFAVDRV
jgi:hypothetical protein